MNGISALNKQFIDDM